MAKSPTVISASTTVKGRIQGQEDVEVLGKVEGHVELEGQLLIDAAARVDAEVEATSITIQGILVGNASAADAIFLEATARVIGDLSAPRIVIDEGARVRGLVETGDGAEAAPKTRARPKRSAPPPKPVARPRKADPVPEPEHDEAPADDDDEEPELPTTARKKKVSVKKRG
jgi:cytoskeletal protein CcmA (bactofilin family)